MEFFYSVHPVIILSDYRIGYKIFSFFISVYNDVYIVHIIGIYFKRYRTLPNAHLNGSFCASNLTRTLADLTYAIQWARWCSVTAPHWCNTAH